jgi:hypothetical protein
MHYEEALGRKLPNYPPEAYLPVSQEEKDKRRGLVHAALYRALKSDEEELKAWHAQHH